MKHYRKRNECVDFINGLLKNCAIPSAHKKYVRCVRVQNGKKFKKC